MKENDAIDMELISIIVPVYNVEKYLKKCIDSLTKQTYKNIEIILINDGSTDESGRICEECKKNDYRIRLFHEKNMGVSNARNVGIRNANGKIITFVDSDDSIEVDMIETMYKTMKEDNADIIICGTKNVNENNEEIINENPIKKQKRIFNNILGIQYMLDEKLYTNVCWGKIYKKSLFDNNMFNENIKIAEDLDVLYKIFFKAQKIIYIPQKEYIWLDRNNSVTKERFNSKWRDEIKVCEDIIKFTQIKCNDITDYAIKRYIRINMTCAIDILKNGGKKEDLKDLQRNIKKYKISNKKILTNKEKVKIFCVSNFSSIVKYIIKIRNEWRK